MHLSRFNLDGTATLSTSRLVAIELTLSSSTRLLSFLRQAFGLRRSHRQALDPLSAVKPAKRGAVLLMRRLGEIGAPMPLAASVEQAVEKLFREGPSPRHMDALQDILPMLKNKNNGSPSMGWSVD